MVSPRIHRSGASVTLRRKPLTLARIKTRDRRGAAVHESGHHIVAAHFGVLTDAWIEPTDVTDRWDGKFWAGSNRFRAWDIQRLSSIKRCMFSCAGMVAEYVWGCKMRPWEESGGDLEYDLAILMNVIWFDKNIMSDSEWEGCECEPAEPSDRLIEAIEKIWWLLAGELWPALLQTSRELIEASRA